LFLYALSSRSRFAAVDPQQRLIGVLFMLRPAERAAVYAEFRALVYGSLQPLRP